MPYYYCLYDRTETQGYTSNKILITLTWFEVNTLEIYQSAIDPTYRNYKRCGWKNIVEDPEPWGVYTNLHRGRGRTKQGYGILDADTVAQFVEELTLAEIEQYRELRRQQLAQEPQRELFVFV